MRRYNIIIAVAICVMVLSGLILVARGQDSGNPFPPPPIVPPDEPDVLPDDVKPAKKKAVTSQKVTDLTSAKNDRRGAPAIVQKSETNKRIKKSDQPPIIVPGPSWDTSNGPKDKMPSDIPVTAQADVPELPEPVLPGASEKKPDVKDANPSDNPMPPLPDFPGIPENEPAVKGAGANAGSEPPPPAAPDAKKKQPSEQPADAIAPDVPPLPDFPMDGKSDAAVAPIEMPPPGVPVANEKHKDRKPEKPSDEPPISLPEKTSGDPMDIAPKPVRVSPVPGDLVLPSEKNMDLNDPVKPGVPAGPEIEPPPDLPSPIRISDISPKPASAKPGDASLPASSKSDVKWPSVVSPLNSDLHKKQKTPVWDSNATAPKQEPKKAKPAKPSFKIMVPLTPKRPADDSAPTTKKASYSEPKSEEEKPTSNRTPSLIVEKSGPSSALLGQPFYYEIMVQNVTATWAYGAVVEDELPYGVRFLSAQPAAQRNGKSVRWQVDIPPNAVQRFRVEVQPTAAGNWTNAARVSVSARQPFVTSIQPTTLILHVNCPATAELNETVEFAIHVTNSSKKDMSDLQLIAEMSEGLQHAAGAKIEGKIERLKVGESTIIPLKAKAVRFRAQTLRVRVESASGQRAEGKASIKIGKAGLQLKMRTPRKLELNDEGEVVVDVVNLRSQAVRNVVVRSQLPAGLQYISATGQGLYRKGTHAVDWLVPQIEAGQVRRLAMKVRADAPGEHAPVVVAHAESGSETKQHQTVRIADSTHLAVNIRQDQGPVKSGQKKLFVVEVVNKGSATATNVQMQLQLPEGLALWQTSGPTKASYKNGVITFQPLAELAPGEKTAFGVTFIGRRVGQYRVAVQLTSAESPQPTVRETSVIVISESESRRN